MKINYKETPSDLATRINIHDLYGSRNIDEWMLEVLPLKKGMKILDVACGAGKQCISFYKELGGDCKIVGVDVSKELLSQAKQIAEEKEYEIKFSYLDFNKAFDFEDEQFDLISCCFAIYYAENIPFTIKEMHRVLKSGGRLFTTGPMPENKQIFYDVIKEATGKEIPPMPGSSRYSTEILAVIKGIFSKVELKIFENPLTFESAEPFIAYTRASLSEDRKLWSDFFTEKESFEKIMERIARVAENRLKKDGKIIMTKVVGGILAVK